jgi:hypothetical protein
LLGLGIRSSAEVVQLQRRDPGIERLLVLGAAPDLSDDQLSLVVADRDDDHARLGGRGVFSLLVPRTLSALAQGKRDWAGRISLEGDADRRASRVEPILDGLPISFHHLLGRLHWLGEDGDCGLRFSIDDRSQIVRRSCGEPVRQLRGGDFPVRVAGLFAGSIAGNHGQSEKGHPHNRCLHDAETSRPRFVPKNEPNPKRFQANPPDLVRREEHIIGTSAIEAPRCAADQIARPITNRSPRCAADQCGHHWRPERQRCGGYGAETRGARSGRSQAPAGSAAGGCRRRPQ